MNGASSSSLRMPSPSRVLDVDVSPKRMGHLNAAKWSIFCILRGKDISYNLQRRAKPSKCQTGKNNIYRVEMASQLLFLTRSLPTFLLQHGRSARFWCMRYGPRTTDRFESFVESPFHGRLDGLVEHVGKERDSRETKLYTSSCLSVRQSSLQFRL